MLCCGLGEAVVVNEVFDGTHVISQLLGEGYRLAHETGHPLPQGIVEPPNMIGFLGLCTDGSVLRSRNHPCVYYRLIGVQRGVLPVGLRNLGPQALGTPAAAIPHVQGHYLAAPGIHGEPHPLFVRLLLHKAGHCVGFHVESLHHHERSIPWISLPFCSQTSYEALF